MVKTALQLIHGKPSNLFLRWHNTNIINPRSYIYGSVCVQQQSSQTASSCTQIEQVYTLFPSWFCIIEVP